jgi:hypothetical protein
MSHTESNSKFLKIKIPNTTPASTFTKQKIVKLRIKDEIKFLYMKEALIIKNYTTANGIPLH